jgi:hypothetical protein
MGYAVSSWFYEQQQSKRVSPVKRFYVGGSDFSTRVLTWPKFTRTGADIIASRATVVLDNADGLFNFFHERLWTFPDTCSAKWGYNHPTSGDELLPLFSGDIKEVEYTEKQCKLHLRDRFWGLTEKKIGDSDITVTYSYKLPSDIAWSLCTCYGELSSVLSSNNPHIDYATFNDWSLQFSTDSVLMSARYDGIKVAEALRKLADMTDSAIWQDGDGKLYFKRFTEPSSLDFVVTRSEMTDLKIKIDGLYLVNKAWVYGNYAVESNYWTLNCFDISTTGVNTYGLHEYIWKDENCWYVNSASALNMAQRKVRVLKYPPKKFIVETPVIGIHRQLGETIRLVESFYSINSGTGWRFDEIEIDMDKGLCTYSMNEAIAGNGFYLDIDSLDVEDRFLL